MDPGVSGEDMARGGYASAAVRMPAVWRGASIDRVGDRVVQDLATPRCRVSPGTPVTRLHLVVSP